ncbi:uncharacterized protein LOC141852897 [Brevipalpus obovatus]|uniref:uncharacterized protein LOC141852897 n=1 Tax=Brevipalpus obovatus TaxID=246614 RepID=UPI003D9F112E
MYQPFPMIGGVKYHSNLVEMEREVIPSARYAPFMDRLRSTAIGTYPHAPFIDSPNYDPSLTVPPTHLARPLTSLRFGDSIYLESYGIHRPESSFHHISSLPVIPHEELSTTTIHPHNSSSSAVPSYIFTPRCSELIVTHHDRILGSERLFNHPSGPSSSHSFGHRNRPVVVNLPNYELSNCILSDGSSLLNFKNRSPHSSNSRDSTFPSHHLTKEAPQANILLIENKPNGQVLPTATPPPPPPPLAPLTSSKAKMPSLNSKKVKNSNFESKGKTKSKSKSKGPSDSNLSESHLIPSLKGSTLPLSSHYQASPPSKSFCSPLTLPTLVVPSVPTLVPTTPSSLPISHVWRPQHPDSDQPSHKFDWNHSLQSLEKQKDSEEKPISTASKKCKVNDPNKPRESNSHSKESSTLNSRVPTPDQAQSIKCFTEISETKPQPVKTEPTKQITPKKSGGCVRRRRFRSGLDMIRTPYRKKRNKITSESNRKNESKSCQTPIVENDVDKQHILSDRSPTEIKKIMVNKALGETVLHRIARQGNMSMVLYCLANNSCDVNARDNAGYTPLHECCAKGFLEIARALLENGAEVDASATGGIRPIHDAVESDNVEVVRLLLSYGSDVNIATYAGLTPLKLARSKVMIDFLRGFISDLTGEVPDVDDDSRDRPILSWKFTGSACFMDLKQTGYNIFDDPVSCEEEKDEFDEILFEMSLVPHLPTYRIRCDEGIKGSVIGQVSFRDSYLRLSDVLTATGCTKDDFVRQHKLVKIVCLSSQYIESNSLASAHSPQRFQSVSSSESCGKKTKTSASHLIELIILDDDVRNILSIESIRIR